ncbi:MAG: sulfite exporter TauE/SafE family protein [Pseudomonadota bacterium]
MIAYLLLGVAAGVFAGFFGLGGGIILVPALFWLFQMSQHQAQGMSLVALILPVGILGAWTYYRANPFPIKPALILALGLFIGAYFGGLLAQQVPEKNLRIAFGVLLVVVGLKTIWGR